MDRENSPAIRRKPVSVLSAILRQPYAEIQQHDDGQAGSRLHSHPMPMATEWKLFWFRRVVLLAFMLCFAIMLLALELLDLYCARQDGIASVDVDLYYLWTYGPTAILTLLVALWNRVDYRVRQMAPWVALSYLVPMPASKTILLDYISPTRPEILWFSFVNRHWTVFTSSAVGVIQTLLIVLSTGLFTVAPVARKLDDIPYQTLTKFVNNGSSIANLGAADLPLNIYDAIRNLDLSYPLGTTDRFVYQEFAPADTSVIESSIQQATVDLVVVDLDCEPADLQVDCWAFSWAYAPCWSSNPDLVTTGPALNSSVSFVTNNCTVTTSLGWDLGKDGDIGNFLHGDVEVCEQQASDEFNDSDVRIVFSIGQARQSGDAGPHPTTSGCNDTAPLAEIDLIKSRSWICTPKLEITRGNVTFNSTTLQLGTPPEIHILSDAQSSPLTNISLWDFDIDLAIYAVDNSFKSSNRLPIDIKGSDYGTNMGVKALERAPNATISELMDTDLYLDLGKALYTELGVQSLHWTITDSGHGTAVGSYTTIQDRLFTRNSVVRGMQSLLGVLMILAGIMIISFPTRAVVPYDTATLGGMLRILADNPSFTSIFRGHGSIDMSILKRMYSKLQFRSRIGHISSQLDDAALLIDEAQGHTPSTLNLPQQERFGHITTWWKPLIIRKPVKTSMVLLVVLLVVLLQTLLVMSNQNSGLMDVSIDNQEHLAWSIVPATVMVGVAIYFKALHSVYRMFAPYCKLRKAVGSKASTSIDSNYMSGTELEVLGLSIPRHQLGLFFMTISAVTASFLTIIVSGVFTAEQQSLSTHVSVSRASWFNDVGSDDNGTIGNSALIAGLVLEVNLTYPAWTYGDLAMASLQLRNGSENGTVKTDSEPYTLDLTSPAIRSSLNCTIYDQESIEGLIYDPSRGNSGGSYGVYSEIPGPEGCEGGSVVFTNSFILDGGEPPLYYSGFVQTNKTGCPSLNYFWGYQASSSQGPDQPNSSVTYSKAMTCFEVIEQVNVSHSFSMPSFVMDRQSPPMADRDSSKLFSSAQVAIPYSNLPKQNNQSSSHPNFFGALTYAYGITETDLGDPSRVTAVADAIQKAHGIIRAQQYNAILRMDEPAGNEITYDAIATRPSRYRLIQNTTSTHVLSALLLAMLVFAILAFFLISTKKVLPKNPSSIAAMASLLADSNVLHDKHDGGTEARFKPHTSPRALYPSDATFRMGWFDNQANGLKMFTINRVDSNDLGERGTVSKSHSTTFTWEMDNLDQMSAGRTRQKTAKKPQGTFEAISQADE